METWKDIAGYEGYYQVSNLGRIKSLRRVIRSGLYWITSKERILKPVANSKGYLTVNLQKGKQYRKHKIHRLVAQAFIPNPMNKPEVNHLNRIKADNRVENLAWCNHSENMEHMAFLGKYYMPVL